MGGENNVVLFCDSKCVIHGAKLKVTKDEPQKEWKNSYTWTATIDTASSKIEELFKSRDEVDCYIVRGTTERVNPHGSRYPRKLKKALKTMYYGTYSRRTKWMNLAIARNLDYESKIQETK